MLSGQQPKCSLGQPLAWSESLQLASSFLRMNCNWAKGLLCGVLLICQQLVMLYVASTTGKCRTGSKVCNLKAVIPFWIQNLTSSMTYILMRVSHSMDPMSHADSSRGVQARS